MTIRDAGGRALQNAVHVWSNIPAVRRYALALWAATRWGLQPAVASLPRAGAPKPRHAPVGDAASTPGTCSQLSHPCPRGPRLGPLQAGKAQPRPRALGLPATPVRPGTRPQATHAHAHSLTCPWGAVAARTAHADRQAAGLRARPPRPRPISAPGRRPPPPDTSVAPVSACPVPTALGVAGCSPAPTPSTALCRQCRPSFCDSRVLCLPRGEPLQPFPAPRPRDRMWCS